MASASRGAAPWTSRERLHVGKPRRAVWGKLRSSKRRATPSRRGRVLTFSSATSDRGRNWRRWNCPACAFTFMQCGGQHAIFSGLSWNAASYEEGRGLALGLLAAAEGSDSMTRAPRENRRGQRPMNIALCYESVLPARGGARPTSPTCAPTDCRQARSPPVRLPLG